MSEVRVVDLKELGVSKEVFDTIYSMGEQDGRADAIDEFAELIESAFLHSKFDITDVRPMAEQLKEQTNGKVDSTN